ncbi:MAG: glycoside hydrolase family 36 protein [Cellulosilyticaceae bacterium]
MQRDWSQIKFWNTEGQEALFAVEVQEEGCFCRIKATYKGSQPTRMAAVHIATLPHGKSGDTPLYAEAYSMLSQTTGTLAEPRNVTGFSDARHYRLPEKEGYFTAYNMLLLLEQPYTLIAYSSAARFVGKIHFNAHEIVLEQDLGRIVVAPGEELVLEEIMIGIDADREVLLEQLGERLKQHHGKLEFEPIPVGWCSWYCYAENVTQQNICDNMATLKAKLPDFKYIQIDDGYQAYMGDYLTTSAQFGHLRELIAQIHDEGFEPAIWVAPFIAEQESELFRTHPEYFIKDDTGMPLASDQVSFGGWRCGPWYMLDGTHPGARAHLKQLFKVMREEWGIKYFKLDANMWGAMPFGERYDQTKTYVEAYRMGMEAILEGVGGDSYVLGCNAPMWPSIGVVHGMRITGDVGRHWGSIRELSQECFYRNWQQGRLWINDPDCVVLDNIEGLWGGGMSTLTEDEFAYHRAHILASGGALLSGDAITELEPYQIEQLGAFLPLPDQAARFDDHTFVVGRQTRGEEQIVTVFNQGDEEKQITVDLQGTYHVADYWDGQIYGEALSQLDLTLRPHYAVVLSCMQVKS